MMILFRQSLTSVMAVVSYHLAIGDCLSYLLQFTRSNFTLNRSTILWESRLEKMAWIKNDSISHTSYINRLHFISWKYIGRKNTRESKDYTDTRFTGFIS